VSGHWIQAEPSAAALADRASGFTPAGKPPLRPTMDVKAGDRVAVYRPGGEWTAATWKRRPVAW
jgi:hypothetical protein